MLQHCKLVSTGGEAKRIIKQGGVRINEDKIGDPNMEITPADGMVVQVGKRKFAQLKVSRIKIKGSSNNFLSWLTENKFA